MNWTAAITILLLPLASLAEEAAPFELHAVAEKESPTTRSVPTARNFGGKGSMIIESTVLMDLTALETASVVQSSIGLSILIKLTPAGQARFTQITKERIGKQTALLLFGTLEAAPVIVEPITGNSLQINGRFTKEEATDLAAKLNRAIVR